MKIKSQQTFEIGKIKSKYLLLEIFKHSDYQTLIPHLWKVSPSLRLFLICNFKLLKRNLPYFFSIADVIVQFPCSIGHIRQILHDNQNYQLIIGEVYASQESHFDIIDKLLQSRKIRNIQRLKVNNQMLGDQQDQILFLQQALGFADKWQIPQFHIDFNYSTKLVTNTLVLPHHRQNIISELNPQFKYMVNLEELSIHMDFYEELTSIQYPQNLKSLILDFNCFHSQQTYTQVFPLWFVNFPSALEHLHIKSGHICSNTIFEKLQSVQNLKFLQLEKIQSCKSNYMEQLVTFSFEKFKTNVITVESGLNLDTIYFLNNKLVEECNHYQFNIIENAMDYLQAIFQRRNCKDATIKVNPECLKNCTIQNISEYFNDHQISCLFSGLYFDISAVKLIEEVQKWLQILTYIHGIKFIQVKIANGLDAIQRIYDMFPNIKANFVKIKTPSRTINFPNILTNKVQNQLPGNMILRISSTNGHLSKVTLMFYTEYYQVYFHHKNSMNASEDNIDEFQQELGDIYKKIEDLKHCTTSIAVEVGHDVQEKAYQEICSHLASIWPQQNIKVIKTSDYAIGV